MEEAELIHANVGGDRQIRTIQLVFSGPLETVHPPGLKGKAICNYYY